MWEELLGVQPVSKLALGAMTIHMCGQIVPVDESCA